MALPQEMAADVAELEMEFAPDGATPHVFTYNGADYPCVPGSVIRGKKLGAGGFGIEADLILFSRAELFERRPVATEKLTYLDRVYRVEDVTVPAGEPFLKLMCSDVNKGA